MIQNSLEGVLRVLQDADFSMREVYISYRLNETDSGIHLENQYTQPSRRKVPGDTSASRFDDMMTVDLNILTRARGIKKQ